MKCQIRIQIRQACPAGFNVTVPAISEKRLKRFAKVLAGLADRA